MVSSEVAYTLLQSDDNNEDRDYQKTYNNTNNCHKFSILILFIFFIISTSVYVLYIMDIDQNNDVITKIAPMFWSSNSLISGLTPRTNLPSELHMETSAVFRPPSTSMHSSLLVPTGVYFEAQTTNTVFTKGAKSIRSIPPFQRRPEVADIDCKRLFDNDQAYANQVIKKRRVYKDTPLNMTCDALRMRIIGEIPRPQVNYSIAIARIVYTDYPFLEYQLSSTYNTNNHYCYIIDKNAPDEFKQDIKRLSECLPNLYIPTVELSFDSAGHNLNKAHYECMKVLIEKPEWKYVMLLQNHDLILHTHAELAKIFSILNGANDIRAGNLLSGRIDFKLNWTIEALGIFTDNTPLTAQERKDAKIVFAKGIMQSSITRESVDWMVNKVNLTKMIDQLNVMSYGVDEQFLNTLFVSDTLGMPGAIHHSCFKKKEFTYLSRLTKWGFGDVICAKKRHNICIFGVENLSYLGKMGRRFLIYNKMLPNHDFAAISCIAEAVHNRTYTGAIDIDEAFVSNHTGVRYRLAQQRAGFNKNNYTCDDL